MKKRICAAIGRGLRYFLDAAEEGTHQGAGLIIYLNSDGDYNLDKARTRCRSGRA